MKKSIFISVIFAALTFTLSAQRPIVQDIQAVAGNTNKINILWNLPSNPDKEITQILVYRDLTPISSYAQLQNLAPIAQLVPICFGFDHLFDAGDAFFKGNVLRISQIIF